MLGNVGFPEILIVLIIALIVFGPKRLPELGRSLGRGIREFRGSLSGEHDDDEESQPRREEPRLRPEEPAAPHEIEAGKAEPVSHKRP